MNIEQPTFAPTPSDSEKLAEWQVQLAAASEAWRQEHPEVVSAKPDWADTLTIEVLDGDDPVDVWAEREIGVVSLSRHGEWRDGVLTWDGGTDAPSVYLLRDNTEDLTVGRMREIASSLMAAIPVVEAAAS